MWTPIDLKYVKLLTKYSELVSAPSQLICNTEMLNTSILLTPYHLQGFTIKHSREVRCMPSTVDPLHMAFHDSSRHPTERTVLLAIRYPRVLRRWHLGKNFKNSLSYQIIQVSLQEGKKLWRRVFPFLFLSDLFLSVFQDVRRTVCFIYKW